MTHTVVAAVFGSLDAAQQAKLRLVEAGVMEDEIGLSTDFTADGLAAECPGQSYSNQPGQAAEVEPTQAYADAARAGACVLRVDLGRRERYQPIERLMKRCGAQLTSHFGQGASPW